MNSLVAQLEKETSQKSCSINKRSKLDSYKDEILLLRKVGLSYNKISSWLLHTKSVSITDAGIIHMVKKWSHHDRDQNTKALNRQIDPQK